VSGFWRTTWLLARKDLLLEARSRELTLAMGLFALASLVLAEYATGAAADADRALLASGLVWLVVLFTAMLGLQRSFAAERDEGLFDALLLAPLDRAAIWAGKVVALTALLLLVEVVLVPLTWLFFFEGVTTQAPSLATLCAALAIANLGIAGAGAFVASLASAARQREVLLPVLFLPAVTPLLIAGVTATVSSSEGNTVAQPLLLLLVYDAVVGVLAWGAFDHVITE
jgi:heme exporter protein B